MSLPKSITLPHGRTFLVSAQNGTVQFTEEKHDQQLTTDGPKFKWSVSFGVKGDQSQTWTTPTLQSDVFRLSDISSPNPEQHPVGSPQLLAMALWITFYWYFQCEAPSALSTVAGSAAKQGDESKGDVAGVGVAAGAAQATADYDWDWRITAEQAGRLGSQDTMMQLERMGIMVRLRSSVDVDHAAKPVTSDNSEDMLFVTRRMFWQLPAGQFLLPPSQSTKGQHDGNGDLAAHAMTPSYPYFPPPPPVYTFSAEKVRHPIRPKAPQMGEVIYTRFIPSVGQFLSFRVASLAPEPVKYSGPVSSNPPQQEIQQELCNLSDTELMKRWLGVPRVSEFWGNYKSDFLADALKPRHSFPVIGLWDGVPFGYFVIYWVKEDLLGRHLDGKSADFDRGLHVFVGEEWCRGRVPIWLGSLVHYCFLADSRTMNVCLEPRIDNARFLGHLVRAGFIKEQQVQFPHKKAWYVRLGREAWNGPAI